MRSIGIAVMICAIVPGGCARSTAPHTPQTLEQLATTSLARIEGRLALPGLKADVEVLRDEWGVPHIYAKDMDDLFFAQGFVVAQDRLWQMELWRRTAEGRVAELVGSAGLQHDRLIRLFRFRGPYDEEEWARYHPEGRRIFTAYAAGVNAFIASAGDDPAGGVHADRHAARAVDAPSSSFCAPASATRWETPAPSSTLARSVAALGLAEANRRAPTAVGDRLTVPAGLDVSLISDEVLKALDGDLYGDLPRPEILPQYRELPGSCRVESTWACPRPRPAATTGRSAAS